MRIVFTIGLLAVAAGLLASCQEPLGPCQTTRDCLDQEVCFEGRCHFACDSEAHCTDGQICLQGACLTIGASCEDDTPCLGVERCVEGRCRLSCTSDVSCPGGSSCQGGACLPVSDGGVPEDGGASGDRPGADLMSIPDRPAEDQPGADTSALDGASSDAARADAAQVDAATADRSIPDSLRPDTSLPDSTPLDAGGFDAATTLACVEQYGAATNFTLCAASESQCAFSALNAGTTCHSTCRLFGGLCLDALDNPTGAGLECEDTGAEIDCTTRHSTDICVCTRDLPPPTCDALYSTARDYLLCAQTDTTCTFHARTAGTSCDGVCQGLGHACLDADNNENGTGNECLPAAAAHDCSVNSSTQICTCERATPRPSCDTLYGAAAEYVLCDESWESCRFNARTSGRSCDDLCGDFGGVCLDAIEDNDSADGGPCVPSAEPNTCATVHSDQICVCSR